MWSFAFGGCASTRESRAKLSTGYQALESKQYDAAIAAADEQLGRAPDGPGAAEALYLRGRALEQRPAASPDEARSNLQAARAAYAEALKHKPAPKLEAYVRTSLANVAYFQDDYPAALSEWGAVYDELDDAEVRAWVLYRIGLCQQRLGNFDLADKTFARVGKEFPNTLPAQRAREHQGARAFTVQLATYGNRAAAENAINVLKREGVPANAADSQGRTVVRVGPLRSYAQAAAVKQRYAQRFPDALILP
jgi:TolA-binding protein